MAKVKKKHRVTVTAERRGALLAGLHELGRCPFGEVIRASASGYLRIQLIDEGPFRGWRIETKKAGHHFDSRPKLIKIENDILEDGLASILKRLREGKADGTG